MLRLRRGGAATHPAAALVVAEAALVVADAAAAAADAAAVAALAAVVLAAADAAGGRLLRLLRLLR